MARSSVALPPIFAPLRRSRATRQPGLPAEITAAVNRRAFELARQMYPTIQNDLQALAWDLIEQGQTAHQVAEAIGSSERGNAD
jgi:hypothetical protein